MHTEPTTAGTLTRGNITYFPVVSGRIEFAIRIRRYLLEHRPRVVAVELPSSLEREYDGALNRMPRMSVIVIPEDSHDDQEQATYIPVEPGDPFVEAVRTAREISAEIVFLEPPTHTKPHVSGTYPEPYSVELIGVEAMSKPIASRRCRGRPKSTRMRRQWRGNCRAPTRSLRHAPSYR